MNKTDEKLLDHDYDGIREFDNPLPGWWLATFYGAIIFAFLYIGYYHFGPGPSPEVELAQDMGDLKALDKTALQAEPGPTEEFMAGIYNDHERREAGHKIFVEKCATCHAVDGGGLIGPNLTDRYWIHGRGSMLENVNVVSEGVLDKGMPPWKLMLKKDEIYSVVAYVNSLKGTHPANPKAPQGVEIKE